MSNLLSVFNDKKAFIPYIMAGAPTLEDTKKYILTFQNEGADIVHIGIPFSDPVIETDVVIRANMRALINKVNVGDIFKMLKDIKDELKIPVVLSTYLNPVFRYGYDNFLEKCNESGVRGIIIPDLPLEESREVKDRADKYDVDIISLITPTKKDRLKLLAENADGYIYLIIPGDLKTNMNGICKNISEMVDIIKKVRDIPVVVECNVTCASEARELYKVADGVVVGSQCVQIIEDYEDTAKEELSKFIKTIVKE